jgi:hypothetical protein
MPSVGAETPVKRVSSKGHSHASPANMEKPKGSPMDEGKHKKKQKLMQKREDGRRSRSLGITGTGTVKRSRDSTVPSLATETLERFKHKWIWHARKMLAAEKQTGRPARGGDKPKVEQEAGHSDAEDDDPGGCGESDGGGQHGAAHLCHGGGLPGAPAGAGSSCCGHAGGHHHAFGCDEDHGDDDGDDDDDDDDDDDGDGCEQGSDCGSGSELSADEDSEGSEPRSADEGEAAGGPRTLEAPLARLEEAQRAYLGRPVGRAMPTNAYKGCAATYAKEGIDGVVAWSGMLPEDPPLSPLATGTPIPSAAALWQDSPGAAAGMLEYFYRDGSGNEREVRSGIGGSMGYVGSSGGIEQIDWAEKAASGQLFCSSPRMRPGREVMALWGPPGGLQQGASILHGAGNRRGRGSTSEDPGGHNCHHMWAVAGRGAGAP